jgi:hypothetical protein
MNWVILGRYGGYGLSLLGLLLLAAASIEKFCPEAWVRPLIAAGIAVSIAGAGLRWLCVRTSLPG